MNTPSVIRVTPLRSKDGSLVETLEAVDDILMRAYTMPSRKSRIERYLALDSVGFVVAHIDSRLVGCGGVIAYPGSGMHSGFGWIGLIATDPDWTGRGVAREVTDYLVKHLSSLGCIAALDGSTSGAPLYEKMGFVDYGITAQFEFSGSILGPVRFAAGCTPATESDLLEIIEFDAPNFGSDRSRLLRYLWHECAGRWVISRSVAGAINGYGIATSTTIGPVVSDSEEATGALIETLCTYDYETQPRINVPHESKFLETISSIDGFTAVRGLRNQRLRLDGSSIGPGVGFGGQRENLVAQCSFGEG